MNSSLEKMRFEDSIRIDFEVNDIIDDSFIAPLILFTFLENSFKHGVSKTVNNPWVKIRLKSSVSEIFFEIENSIPEIPDNSGEGFEVELINLAGQVIFRQSGYTGQIDVSHLQSGIYLVKVNSENNEIIAGKVMIGPNP